MKCPKCLHENPDTQKYCGECATALTSADAQPSFTKTLETPLEEVTRGTLFAGRYEIIEELGRGGMGRVYRVEDRSVNEEIALKLIRPEISADKKTIDRFRNELKIARKIRHKNITGMYDLGEDKGTHFITMEYVSGEDLKSFIRRSGQLSTGTTIRISKQICEGLSEAHNLGIIHRDLKPSNIMVDKEGNVRIMDFGIARSLKTKGATGVGSVIGTPEYMSPEQAEAKGIDQRTDIYSLGIILYEMATGELPFEGDSPLSVAMKHKGEIPRNPKEINPQIPDDLNEVILKCLKKEKEQRYQSANEVCSELKKIEQQLPTTKEVVPKRKTVTSKEITVTFGLNKLLIPAMIIAAVIITGVLLLKLIPNKKIVAAPKIENSIAVISFDNQTGDEAYDYLQEAIPNLLITSLEQSGALYVMTWERMNDLLKQIGKGEVEVVDRDLGFKLCRMEGVESIVIGSLVKAGEMFATDVKILDVETKKLLDSAGSRGEGEGSIIRTQIDELSREISEGIGISGLKIDRPSLSIADVTTSSIEAYNYYLKGRGAQRKLYWEEASKYYERAVELDPNFASAYFHLANAYSWIGNTKARYEAYEKAKENMDRTSGKERLFLEAYIARFMEGDNKKYLEKLNQIIVEYPKEKGAYFSLGYYYEMRGDYDQAIDLFERSLELDPGNGLTLNQLGYTYAHKREYEKALEYFERYASAFPDDANPYDSMGEIYYLMGRFDDALVKLKEAVEVKPDFPISYNRIGYIYALEEDYSSAEEWIKKGADIAVSPGGKMDSHILGAFVQYWLGKYQDSFSELQEAVGIAESVENWGMINQLTSLMGWINYEKGAHELSRKYYGSWFKRVTENQPRWKDYFEFRFNILLGLIDMKEDKLASAKSKLEKAKSLLQDLDLDSENEYEYLLLQGEVALAENSPEKTIEIFEKMEPVEEESSNARPLVFHNIPFVKRDILARAYQENGETEKAIAEYERLISIDTESLTRHLIHPKYHFQIAKLYEQIDWKGKAIEHYEKFLDLWKDADPGLPEVEDARKRLAGLRGS